MCHPADTTSVAPGAPSRAVRFDTLRDAVPAVIVLDFDPVARVGEISVRIDTAALGAAILLALLLTGWLASRTPAGLDEPDGRDEHLRVEDMAFIVLSILPGAVIGGRIGYVLLHLDFYRSMPGAIVDPGQGSLELTLAIVGGTLTGSLAAQLLGEPVGRWLHVATLPLLAVLSLGKVAQALGGGGQGAPSGLPWATSYVGERSWGSLAPDVASHPAQLYEAIGAFVVLVVMTWVMARNGRRDSRTFLLGFGLWLIVRIAVATTWRDPPVAGPFNIEQLLCIGLLGACVSLAVILTVRGRTATPLVAEPDWPDPETRPHF
jgi:phosphatidylglycerol:prolipoprotein diacylglycerol transferase